MTVKMYGSTHRYHGTSDDTKPTGEFIPTGSEFTELNTGNIYVWDGQSWRASPKYIHKDERTESAITIDFAHHEIHEGDTFRYIELINIATSGGTQEYLVVTPAGSKRGHFIWSVSGDEKIFVEFYKGTTSSAQGTDVSGVIINADCGSANTPDVKVYKGPTVLTDGALIDAEWIDKRAPSRGLTEHILGESGSHLFRVTAEKDSANIVVKLIWYEHTDSDA